MMSVTSSFTPGTVVNSCSTPSMRMLVTAAPGWTTAGCAQRVAEGVAEARLERFDDELRAVLGDDLFGQVGRCEMSMVFFLLLGTRYLMPLPQGC
jgi:hypothetical protein